jgi:hypothetical protein
MANLADVISSAVAQAGDFVGAYLPEGFDVAAHGAALADLREHISLLTLAAASLPVKGSRGIRGCKVLSVAGPITVHRKYIPGGGRPESPGFAGCKRRVTRGARKMVSKCGATLGSMAEASQTIGELLHFTPSPSKVRELTLSEGELLLQAVPSRSEAFDKATVIPGTCTGVEETMLVSMDGTCAPCSHADTGGIQGRDGKQAKGRELKVGLVGAYKWLNEHGIPVIPPDKRQYVVTHEDCDAIGAKVLALARALGYGTVKRVQFMGDGAIWLARLAKDAFKGAEFTVDFYHACGYLDTLCKGLGIEDHARVFKKTRRLMKAYSADTALRHLQKTYPSAMANLDTVAKQAYDYLDERRKNMEYGRLRKQGYLIGSGHIESACKFIVGTRCKQAGMHWRHHNAAYVSAIRAAVRSNTFWAA